MGYVNVIRNRFLCGNGIRLDEKSSQVMFALQVGNK